MKILIIQEHGRHEKNCNFRESENLKRALNRVDPNIEVTIWGLGYDNFRIPFKSIVKSQDVVILLENYETNNWIPDLSKLKQLKLFWSIDSHCVLQYHQELQKKHNIDIVLCSNVLDVDNFKSGKWFPSCYPKDLITPLNIPKSINFGFCGNSAVPNRKEILEYLSQNLGLQWHEMVIGNDMVKLVNTYKIHFNYNTSHEINYRTFETLGCKTLLFTNYTPKLEKLFEIDKHLVVYKNLNDLRDKLKYYLNNESERLKIENSGYNHVVNNHSYDNRAKQLLSIIGRPA